MNIKTFFFAILACSLISCTNEKSQETDNLKKQVAELEKKIEDLKPGLGEIMGVIQQHHAKLYFSGKDKNWDLAAYQIDEIK